MPVVTPGTVIMSCEPFAYAADLGPGVSLCDYCLKSDEGGHQLRRCTGCRMVHYCDRTCQVKSWKLHKYECKSMKEFPQGLFPCKKARVLLRILVKLQDGKDYFDEIDTENGKVKRRFPDLISHSAEFGNDSLAMLAMEHIINSAKLLLKYNPEIDLSDKALLLEHCGRIQINAFVIKGDGPVNPGTGIYLGGSIFDHSCDFSATQSFEGPRMIVRNIKELPEGFPIEKVTVPYIEGLKPSNERRKELAMFYYLDCQCEMCLSGRLDKEMRGIICYKNGCNALIDSKELESPCQACGHKLDKEKVEEILKTEKLVAEGIDKVRPEWESGDAPTPEMFLAKLKKLNFSDTHWLMNFLYYKASEFAAGRGDFENAYQYGSKHVKGLRLYVNPNDPKLGGFLSHLTVFALELNRFGEAKAMAKETEAILKVAYGENSQVYKHYNSGLIVRLRAAAERLANLQIPSNELVL